MNIDEFIITRNTANNFFNLQDADLSFLQNLEEQSIIDINYQKSESIKRNALQICQSQLSETCFNRIFEHILNKESVLELPRIEENENKLIDQKDYTLILETIGSLEEKQYYEDMQSLYYILILLAPYDYRSYIGYDLTIANTVSKNAGVSYFIDISSKMINPIFDYHASKFLLNNGNKIDASKLIERSIQTIDNSDERNDEIASVLEELREYKKNNLL